MSWENWGFPVDFPLNQSIDGWFWTLINSRIPEIYQEADL